LDFNMVIIEGQLRGSFTGYKNRDTVFEFFSGAPKKWIQAEYKYLYHYAYMPQAKVVQEGGRYMLHVDGVSESVEVRRA